MEFTILYKLGLFFETKEDDQNVNIAKRWVDFER